MYGSPASWPLASRSQAACSRLVSEAHMPSSHSWKPGCKQNADSADCDMSCCFTNDTPAAGGLQVHFASTMDQRLCSDHAGLAPAPQASSGPYCAKLLASQLACSIQQRVHSPPPVLHIVIAACQAIWLCSLSTRQFPACHSCRPHIWSCQQFRECAGCLRERPCSGVRQVCPCLCADSMGPERACRISRLT